MNIMTRTHYRLLNKRWHRFPLSFSASQLGLVPKICSLPLTLFEARICLCLISQKPTLKKGLECRAHLGRSQDAQVELRRCKKEGGKATRGCTKWGGLPLWSMGFCPAGDALRNLELSQWRTRKVGFLFPTFVAEGCSLCQIPSICRMSISMDERALLIELHYNRKHVEHKACPKQDKIKIFTF